MINNTMPKPRRYAKELDASLKSLRHPDDRNAAITGLVRLFQHAARSGKFSPTLFKTDKANNFTMRDAMTDIWNTAASDGEASFEFTIFGDGHTNPMNAEGMMTGHEKKVWAFSNMARAFYEITGIHELRLRIAHNFKPPAAGQPVLLSSVFQSTVEWLDKKRRPHRLPTHSWLFTDCGNIRFNPEDPRGPAALTIIVEPRYPVQAR